MAEQTCPVCSAAGCTVWFELERGTILRCPAEKCGLGFLAHQPDDETLQGYYADFYYPEHGIGVFENSTDAKGEQHFRALDQRVGLVGKKVLDYGCGVGNFLEVGRRHGAAMSGLEFDDLARKTAQDRGFQVVSSTGDLEPASLGAVYMNDVIEHLRDPLAMLRDIYSLLEPGGALFVATMNMRGLKPRVIGARWDVVTNPTHLWFYNGTSLRLTLEEAGFDPIEEQRWPVQFDHHGPARRALQRGLQRFGLDGSLRMLAHRPAR